MPGQSLQGGCPVTPCRWVPGHLLRAQPPGSPSCSAVLLTPPRTLRLASWWHQGQSTPPHEHHFWGHGLQGLGFLKGPALHAAQFQKPSAAWGHPGHPGSCSCSHPPTGVLGWGRGPMGWLLPTRSSGYLQTNHLPQQRVPAPRGRWVVTPEGHAQETSHREAAFSDLMVRFSSCNFLN